MPPENNPPRNISENPYGYYTYNHIYRVDNTHRRFIDAITSSKSKPKRKKDHELEELFDIIRELCDIEGSDVRDEVIRLLSELGDKKNVSVFKYFDRNIRNLKLKK